MLAVQRVPTQSSAQLRVVLQNAERRGIERLVTACRDELRVRGGLELDASTARRSVEQALAVSGKPLMDVVEAAFVSIPPRDYEVALLKVLVESPGASFQTIEAAYGRRDTALVGGHLVYDRFGFFRQFLEAERDQSSILMTKTKRSGGVTWQLKDEVLSVFRKLKIV
jgi:hypothetical protein